MAALRPADAADLPSIVALLGDCGLPWKDLRSEHMPFFLVAMQGGTLQAVVGLEHYGDQVLLRSLAVQSGSRSSGLGQRMAVAAEEQARQAGAASIHLLTTTARAFFPRLGYRELDRSEAPAALQASTEFAGLCPASAIYMKKFLS